MARQLSPALVDILSLQQRLNRGQVTGVNAIIRGKHAPIDVSGIELVPP
jgi:hypothetical protein